MTLTSTVNIWILFFLCIWSESCEHKKLCSGEILPNPKATQHSPVYATNHNFHSNPFPHPRPALTHARLPERKICSDLSGQPTLHYIHMIFCPYTVEEYTHWTNQLAPHQTRSNHSSTTITLMENLYVLLKEIRDSEMSATKRVILLSKENHSISDWTGFWLNIMILKFGDTSWLSPSATGLNWENICCLQKKVRNVWLKTNELLGKTSVGFAVKGEMKTIHICFRLIQFWDCSKREKATLPSLRSRMPVIREEMNLE